MFKQFAKLESTGIDSIRLVLLALSVCLFWAAPAAAQYPTKPIRFIVPYAPGSSPDAICRLIGAELEIGRAHV